MQNIISVEKADVILENNFLIKIRIKENADLEKEDIIQIQEAKKKLVNQHPHLVLFIPPKYGSISKSAREYSASKEVNQNAIAKAIIVKEFHARLTSNLFLKINKPPVTVKLFAEETDAEQWLYKMQNDIRVFIAAFSLIAKM